MENWFQVLAAFLGGGACVAFISFLGDRFKFREERKAKKEDREAEKKERMEQKADKTAQLTKEFEEFKTALDCRDKEMTEQIAELKSMQEAQSNALMIILLDRILHLGQSFIAKGEITFDDRRRLHQMHDCYHSQLGGNGDADLVMDGVDELPLKK